MGGPWIDAESIPFQSLKTFLDLSRESDGRFEYTVAWLDCFAGRNARGIFFRGNHRPVWKEFPPETRPEVAFRIARLVAEPLHHQGIQHRLLSRSRGEEAASVVTYDSFFYPLDSIRQWNLLYGKKGFVQYQCVIPESNFEAFEELLDRVALSGMGSFLGVLKQFGSAPPAGMLSFPRPGVTLALDFAMRGERTLQLLRSLDQIVLESGGALYPAKDARMSPALFEASFPRWRSFVPFIDPKMSSSFWRRVTGAQ